MDILHIEHPISSWQTWKQAFDRFAPARERAGARGHVVSRPTDDPLHVCIDLVFDDEASARTFRDFLEQQVWTDPQKSPALAGRPITRILHAEEVVPFPSAAATMAR